MKNLNFNIKWNFTLESKFTTAFLKEFTKDKKWWAFKIPDLIRTIKPFDFFWINKWWVYFCEVKMIDWDIFNFSILRNNQYTALKRIYLLIDNFCFINMFSIVLIYSKKYNTYKIINFKDILKAEKQGKNFIKLNF